jgi:hypothetical protein
MGHVLCCEQDAYAEPGRTSLTPYVPIHALFKTHSGLRVCENIPVGRVMGKERMEPAELPG